MVRVHLTIVICVVVVVVVATVLDAVLVVVVVLFSARRVKTFVRLDYAFHTGTSSF